MVPYHHPHTVALNCIRFIRHTLHRLGNRQLLAFVVTIIQKTAFHSGTRANTKPLQSPPLLLHNRCCNNRHSASPQPSETSKLLRGDSSRCVYKTSKAGREQNTHSGRCEQQQRRQRCAVLGVLAPSATTAEVAAVAAAEEWRWW